MTNIAQAIEKNPQQRAEQLQEGLLGLIGGSAVNGEQRQEVLDKEIEPIIDDFAHRPIKEGFDWKNILGRFNDVLPVSEEDPLFLVVFRSQRAPDADVDLLMSADTKAFEAANRSPALLHYFGGEVDAYGYTVSFCLWTEREAAALVSQDPDHRSASALAKSMYVGRPILERHNAYLDEAGEPKIVQIGQQPAI